MKPTLIEQAVEEIFSLYQQHGSEDYIGEKVSQIEHMTQAAVLAETEGYEEDVILAAFFHDIGHLCQYMMPVEKMGDCGVVDHENLGYQYLLQKGFTEKVAKMVRSHVEAKRYLTYKEPAYYNDLSEASKKTLELQGGIMTKEEALAFEEDPLHEVYVQLRRWDDKAKVQHIPIPSLDKYKQMATRHLEKNS
jgi:phosphonate degradation associated HDIG domain protein